MSEISKNTTEKFAEAYQQNNKQNALQRGVVKNGITASAETIQRPCQQCTSLFQLM